MAEKTEKTAMEKSEIVSWPDSMSKSIKREVEDLFADYGEIGIDLRLEDSIFREIPFLKTAITALRIGNSIKERALVEKMYRFVKQMNEGCENDAERDKRAGYFKNNKKKRTEELKYLIILLDRYVSPIRANWLAKVYLAYLEKEITWDEVLVFSECIDKIIPAALKYLDFYIQTTGELLHKRKNTMIAGVTVEKTSTVNYNELLSRVSNVLDGGFDSQSRQKMHTDRLVSAGLVEQLPISLDDPFPLGITRTTDTTYVPTKTGVILMRILSM